MVNTPIPHSLKSEAKKAAKILREFTMPNAKAGPDKLIPAGIFAKAKGLAIITVFKAGFLVTARGGSGIVIAKLDDDNFDYGSGWSAPSAIGLAGLGGGFEIGMEVTDFVIILNTRTAVDAFSKGGNLTLGGNFTIAAGPLGRNIEGDIAVRSAAAIYTYSKTKGIFAGISVEGSALIERKDANRKFYGKAIRAHQILQGKVDIPEECQALYRVLEEHKEMAMKAALKMGKEHALKAKDKMQSHAEKEASYRYGISVDKWRTRSSKAKSKSSSKGSKLSESKMAKSKSEWNLPQSSPPTSRSFPSSTSASAFSNKPMSMSTSASAFSSKPMSMSTSASAFSSKPMSMSTSASAFSSKPMSMSTSASAAPNRPVSTSSSHTSISRRRSNSQSYDRPSSMYDHYSDDEFVLHDEEDGLWVIADYPYKAQLPCDLSFDVGEKIFVTTRTNRHDDWWEGVNKDGRQGIFPANYFHIL